MLWLFLTSPAASHSAKQGQVPAACLCTPAQLREMESSLQKRLNSCLLSSAGFQGPLPAFLTGCRGVTANLPRLDSLLAFCWGNQLRHSAARASGAKLERIWLIWICKPQTPGLKIHNESVSLTTSSSLGKAKHGCVQKISVIPLAHEKSARASRSRGLATTLATQLNLLLGTAFCALQSADRTNSCLLLIAVTWTAICYIYM